MCKNLFLLPLLCALSLTSFSQKNESLPKSFIYKKVDTTSLKMEVIYPPKMETNKKYPALVFFFGGGWITGSLNQFRNQANYFSKKGIVCFLVDYRVQSRQKTTPFESLKDAKSAMRYVRKNATTFHINPDSIIASGGSAGGHLAAATALIDGYNESTDDLSVSPKPNALVLYNPVIDNGPGGGYGYERIGDKYKDFSPIYNIKKNSPPTIIFLGTNDKLIPVETINKYKKLMENKGNRCEVVLYEGQGHGFFNKKEYLAKTMSEADKFLTSLGYIK
nr:alpha/beta hydrolase [uncultured Pedobacter sp.]